jgi:hypothetical protein
MVHKDLPREGESMTSISFKSTGQSVVRLTQQQKAEIKRQKEETRRREERRERSSAKGS